MRIVVYPHDLAIGGSQLNAIEIAGATRDLGHDVVVYGQPGPLVEMVEHLSLEFVASPGVRLRPTPSIVSSLRRLSRERRIDVLHGYEWPPILEARLASVGAHSPACIGTVMSMAVASFIPRQIPLVVGTAQIAASERKRGRHDVHLIEPPVDTSVNFPDPTAAAEARRRYGLDRDALVVAVVCRLESTLKLEGLLCAIEVVPTLPGSPVLLVAGDGPARDEIEEAARRANARAGRLAVLLTGELADPRPVYATADVVLGMGGSALRALAMGRPVVVQGKLGFWRTLTPGTLDSFLWTGWYGVGEDADDGPRRLAEELVPLLGDPALREELSHFGVRLINERFSLRAAAERQVALYEETREQRRGTAVALAHDTSAGARWAAHTFCREVTKRLGRSPLEDFNARPVAELSAGDLR